MMSLYERLLYANYSLLQHKRYIPYTRTYLYLCLALSIRVKISTTECPAQLPLPDQRVSEGGVKPSGLTY